VVIVISVLQLMYHIKAMMTSMKVICQRQSRLVTLYIMVFMCDAMSYMQSSSVCPFYSVCHKSRFFEYIPR